MSDIFAIATHSRGTRKTISAITISEKDYSSIFAMIERQP
jgi:hypothetical protein